MRYLMLLTALICVFYQFGCSEYSHVQMTDTEQIFISDSQVLYETLWNEYGWRFNDQSDLDALRTITSTQTYLNYLAEVHPTETPVASLEAYFEVAPPDPARYTPVLQQWIDTPTAEDIAISHRETMGFRDVYLLGFNLRCLQGSYAHLQDCFDGRGTGERVVGYFFTDAESDRDPAVQGFLQRHKISMGEFNRSFDNLANETLKADAMWLDEQMSRLGRAQGLLWSAIQRPALMGEILHNFSSTALFLLWTEEMYDIAPVLAERTEEDPE